VLAARRRLTIQDMQLPHSLLWQHPYVNLWKVCGVGQWPKGDSARQGDVTSKVVSYQAKGSRLLMQHHDARQPEGQCAEMAPRRVSLMCSVCVCRTKAFAV
jgi:hypothetical protein